MCLNCTIFYGVFQEIIQNPSKLRLLFIPISCEPIQLRGDRSLLATHICDSYVKGWRRPKNDTAYAWAQKPENHWEKHS